MTTMRARVFASTSFEARNRLVEVAVTNTLKEDKLQQTRRWMLMETTRCLTIDVRIQQISFKYERPGTDRTDNVPIQMKCYHQQNSEAIYLSCC